jgi:hypothetical protein
MFVSESIETFIRDDQQGLMGENWRFSKKKFKSDLKSYLIKGLVNHMKLRFERNQAMLINQYQANYIEKIRLTEHTFNPKLSIDLDEMQNRDVITEPPASCMGLQSAGASTGLGLSFGAVLVILTPVTIVPGLILAVTGSAVLETFRRANWTRE